MDGTGAKMAHCHCSMCRKAHVAAFATFVIVATDNLHWLSGREAVAEYASSPTRRRAFCRRCGSVVPWAENAEEMRVPAGCLDDDPGIRPTWHQFVGSKAPWHTIVDDLPRADTYPPGSAGPVVEQPRRTSGRPGVLRGSCLCDAAVYEVRTPFLIVHNCHCSRCRKARSAAYTTNGFTAPDGLHYLRGVDVLRRFKVPDAQFFAPTFCSVCGSGLPGPGARRGFAVIPFGTLDDDPGRAPDDHIFTASKAPWHHIADGAPQFAEGPQPPTRSYFQS